MSKPSDSELVRRARARDSSAWALLVERYGRLVSWAVRRQLKRAGRSWEEADDLFQVVWSRIWSEKLLAGLKDPDLLSSWLVSLAVNETRAYVRARTRKREAPHVSLDESGLLETMAQNASTNPDRAALSREIGELIEVQLKELSARDRLVLRLFFEEGVKTRVISESLGAPHNTILSVVSRAREKVSKALRSKGIEL